MEGKRQLEKRDFGKRLSLDSSLVEYMDSNKYIEHLLTQLEEQHRSLWREKLAVARLQREVAQRTREGAMHEKLIHELEEERHLRLQSEKRLQEVTLESEHNRIQMLGLQRQFSRMEETVRNLLQSHGSPEQRKEETVHIKVYQEKLSEEERKHKEALDDLHVVLDEDWRSESSSADEGKEKTKLLLERLKALEAENSALALENENQREQYERCLDEVANQVVQALLTQKDLREECVKLKTRVFDLEQQNRTLSILFQQRVRPTSDLLFQKLHSRILDLSSGDILSEVERNPSLTLSGPDAEQHDHQVNAKPGTTVLKCPGLGVIIPGPLCMGHSCSSSELSLSSTCSEYSSGSSYTWHDGKNLRKRSSQNWDKRLSIDSSLPSGFASPAGELPPTHIKESHILEGLRKLQKRKVLLEPPSVITKWGYKDCMNSNEGIYSPGIKSSSLKDYPPCNPVGKRNPCKEPQRTFTYDTDSHEDADDDSSSLALLQTLPHQGCSLHSKKLTHSVSDSLFDLEPHEKHFPEASASVYPRERPERLAHCASHCLLERKLHAGVQLPWVQRERNPYRQGHDHMTVNLQLSDTDDNEPQDELHIESSDERSPSDLSLTVDTDKSMENLDTLVGFGKSELGSPDEEEKQVLNQLEMRPRTFSFIKQQRVMKRTSSEECVTVIFDAENGEPVEFSSHQTGVVTVTQDEISINTAPGESKEEHTERLSQGIVHLQPGAAERDYPFLRRPEEETERNIPKVEVVNAPVVPMDSFHPRTVTPSTTQQKLTSPIYNMSYQSNSRSLAPKGICQKQSQTKIHARGKSSPQKSRIIESEASTLVPSSSPVSLEKPSGFPPGKLSRFMKTESPGPLCGIKADSHIPKHTAHPSHSSKIPSKREWVYCPKRQPPGSQSRPLIESEDNGEPPTRDKHSDSGSEAGMNPNSLPSPPERSVSLLLKPSHESWPSHLSAKSETKVPNDTAKTGFSSPLLKGSSAPVISSSHTMTEAPRKKSPSIAFKKPISTQPLSSTEAMFHTRCPAHAPSDSFAMMATEVHPKVSPKRITPQTSLHQIPGTIHRNTELQTPKTSSSTHEPLEISSSKSASPGRKGQLVDSSPTCPKSSYSGDNESPSSQVNSSSFCSSPPSSSSKSHITPHGCQNTHDKGLKTRLPVGLKVLMKSPQLLRKSSTVPGKQEKDSLNEASKSSVATSKSKPKDCRSPTNLETSGGERHTAMLGLPGPDSAAEGLLLETAQQESLDGSILVAEGRDRVENRPVKRSLSSSKPHLKPALGMNGAKARSQSFSAHSGDKPSTPPMEGPGKIRTQIITNTADRGNSLTRQSTSTEGSPNKSPSAPTHENLSGSGRSPKHPFSRQASLGNTGSSSSQHGSPSKLPLRIHSRSEGLLALRGTEEQQACVHRQSPQVAVPEEQSSENCRCPPTTTDCPGALQALGRTQYPNHSESSRMDKLETSGRHPGASTIGTGAASPEAPLSPTIEEKVMLCIQENVEKGQVQTKPTSVEAKPKAGPSFASWFGFRKSRLPALSSRKMDVSKTKIEKKDTKGLGFGNKQLKSERKKERKKPELQCESENELNRDTKSAESPDNGFQSKKNLKISQVIYNPVKFEQRNSPSPVPGATKDTFMTELLNRVDKKGAQPTESGSNNASCRSMLKGASQDSCLTVSSGSTQGSHKKNFRIKADMETPRDSLIKEANENLPEDEDDTIADSAFQSHIIESNCQMRTLDSGIGTFPLPDSANRSAGRYTCQPESSEDNEPFLSLQPTSSSVRAQTLEREVPSSTDRQRSAEKTIVHSISDPIMTARGIRPPQSRLPKPASLGKTYLQKESEVEPSPQTSSSFKYAEDLRAKEPTPYWEAATETQVREKPLER
ncbi:nck-associated protein 5 isoform X2 [Perognathus longimembris pacificus]|uniref:nck-associated protein 5 isoform X2 n=1 Tax=Perognathus longimembris pacificus TaxID=214514 RepID=UPI002018C5B7|nr:nck-associated protein 5 isoform X2 [Perognathus longimembris pacificus]